MPEDTRGLNWILIAALAWGLGTSPWAGGAEPTPDTSTEAEGEERLPWFVHEIIDPSRPAEQRQPDLDLLIREADEGGRSAAGLLGRLYFMGEDHPARPFARDVGQAEHYLQVAMASGDLEAMLWLAEIELLNGRALEAAIWVQAYIRLRPEPDEAEDGTGYVPALLARIESAPGGSDIDRDTLAEFVAGFLQSHGDRLREAAAGPDHRGTGWAKFWFDVDRPECNEREMLSVDTSIAGSRRTPGGLSLRSGRRPLKSSGLAHFLLRIRADGSVLDAMLVHSVPDAEYGLRVKPVALSMTFNEVPSDCRTRWALAPFNLVFSRAGLAQ